MAILFQQSPNYHKGRYAKVTHLVIHAMAGFYQPSINLFMNPKNMVSAHYCISQKGDVIQLVKEQDTAWHVCSANPFTVGIELEDGNQCLKGGMWITPPLFRQAISLAADICVRNAIPIGNIIEHSDAFLRKFKNNHSDAGPFFDIQKFRAVVAAEIASRNAAHKAVMRFSSFLRPGTGILAGEVPSYPSSTCPSIRQ